MNYLILVSVFGHALNFSYNKMPQSMDLTLRVLFTIIVLIVRGPGLSENARTINYCCFLILMTNIGANFVLGVVSGQVKTMLTVY